MKIRKLATATAAGAIAVIAVVSAPTAGALTQNHPQTAVLTLSKSDTAYIKSLAKRVVDDITELDTRVQDGIQVDTRMALLANDFSRLASAGVPPKVKASLYVAKAKTLANFATMAADEYTAGDEMSGGARYEVIRKEAASLLAMINKGLKTNFQLP